MKTKLSFSVTPDLSRPASHRLSARALLLGLVLSLASVAMSQPAVPGMPAAYTSTYTNPASISLADPCILREGDTYYMYGTSDATNPDPGFDVYTSPNLVEWTRAGRCYSPTRGSWGNNNYWAPEVIKKDGAFYLHYTVFSRAEGRRNICVAKSSSPLGPFTDYSGPLVPDKSVIDSHIYHDDKTGDYYIYCVPEQQRPSGILVARLSPDFRSLLSTPIMCLKGDFGWEDLWIEGAIIHEHNGTLYMMYSGSAFWEAEYSLGYATATSPLGPWTKSPTNPILTQNDYVQGPGHNGLAWSPDGSELFCVYHAHEADYSARRVIAMDRIQFDKATSGPDLLTIPQGPSHTPQPLPSGAKPLPLAISDDFDGDKLDANRWYVYKNYPDKRTVNDDALTIAAAEGDFWRTHQTGENICLERIPTGDFAIETSVTMDARRGQEQAFLTLWQDHDNYVTFAAGHIEGPKFAITTEMKGKADSRLAPNAMGWPVCLRLEKRGDTVTCLASSDGRQWRQIDKPVKLKHIAPRYVGLGAYSPASDRRIPAHFDYFRALPLQ